MALTRSYIFKTPITIDEQYYRLTQAIHDGLSHPYFQDLDNFVKAIKFRLIVVKEPFEIINPKHRFNRGLINGLGSIFKSITRNLDQEDAEKYDNQYELYKRTKKPLLLIQIIKYH